MRFIALFFLLFSTITPGFGWGFHAHRQINRLAVFGLPPEMIGFYKHHLGYLTENAVNPDRRRYAVEGEAQRHYIDLDVYGDSAAYKLPRNWNDAVARFTEDTLQAYGIAPWWIMRVKFQLTEAFVQRDVRRILSLSADLGHYIGDLNVPLHTTANYNGQLTGQHGIHGLWEGRIPELFATDYDFWLGQAQYLYHPQQRVWQALAQAHNAVDSVLRFEQILSKRFPSDKKYSFEQRGAVTQRVYSQAYVDAYHRMLGGQVERQMRAAVRMVRDFWFTCWVDAGQPDLAPLASFAFDAAEADSLERVKRAWENGFFRRVRPHDTGKCDFNSEFGIMNFELKGVLGENSSKHLPVAHAPTRLPRTGRGRDKPVACAKGKFGEAKSGRIFHPLNKRRFGQISPETMNAKRQTVNAKRIALSESSIKLFRNPVMLRTFA